MKKPTKEEAEQFALMLHVGLPPIDAILYFLDEEEASDPSLVEQAAFKWSRNPAVARESERLMGGAWEEMSLDQRIKKAVEKHYAEKAYFLFSRNYSLLEGAELTKAQAALRVLEQRMAGTSGQATPMEEFYRDLQAGKLDSRLKQAQIRPALKETRVES